MAASMKGTVFLSVALCILVNVYQTIQCKTPEDNHIQVTLCPFHLKHDAAGPVTFQYLHFKRDIATLEGAGLI
jgi:hypothetical protein